MSDRQSDHTTIEQEAARFEVIEGLNRALDFAYERLIRAARNEWERRFTSKDPSDACVSVRVTSADAKTRSVPASGFLKVRGKTFRRLAAKFSFPRLAR